VAKSGRVLIDALGSTVGGGREYARHLIRELDRDPRGLSFTVLVAEGSDYEAGGDGVDLQRVRIPRRPAALGLVVRSLYMQFALPALAHGFDLLYAPTDMAPSVPGVPLVVMVQNLHIYDRRFYDNARLRLVHFLAARTLRRAERIVFPSAAAWEVVAARESLARERCVVVHHGFVADDIEERNPAPGERYLFLPCAIERHKNIELLIRSLRHLDAPEIEVWIAGSTDTDPAYAGSLRRLAQDEGVADRVRFLGPLPHAQVLHHYARALALVFCSKLESFGLPILEAMASGTPIVASDLPVFREIAGDAVLYVPPDDPVALARAIERVGADAEGRDRRVEAGRKRVERFPWKASADHLCAVFRDVIGQ
jgi:glycosyltransferase involved in cell wall biosynthesis